MKHLENHLAHKEPLNKSELLTALHTPSRRGSPAPSCPILCLSAEILPSICQGLSKCTLTVHCLGRHRYQIVFSCVNLCNQHVSFFFKFLPLS